MPSKTNVLARCCSIGVFLLFSCCLFAQKTVTGKVSSNADKQPIAGATIQVKGTKIATQSNSDGTFSVSSPRDIGVLVITVVGFEPVQIPVSGRQSIGEIGLSTSTTSLNDVVVTGYTAQKKKDITGAVSVVNVKEMKQSPVGTGEEALQGRAAGVTIITSGQPGAPSDIRIRGMNSFGNNNPLIIVDGVRGDIHDINVNDIESVQVLKDASAAIYGVAGSNGVIIVTTKKGRAGKARVTYDGFYGITTRGKGYDLANPTLEIAAIWQQQRNSGIANPSSKQYGNGANPKLPDYLTPTGYSVCNCSGDSVINPALYDKNNYQITKANKAGTNWYNEITRQAPEQSHNLSVSGGSDRSTYLFSFGYLNQQGIALNSYLKRYSVRANNTFNIKDKIRIGENAYLFYKDNPQYYNQQEGSPFTTALREDEIIPIYDIKGNYAGTKSQDLGNSGNPYADVARSANNRTNNWDITGNVFAEVDLLKHFTVHTSFGGVVDNNAYRSFSYVPYENAEGNTGVNSFNEGSGYNSSWTYTNTLSYTNTFGLHSVRALVGTEAVSSQGRYISAGRSNYFSENPNYWILNTGSPSGQSNSGGAYQSSLWSQFARVEYGYDGKYLINASIRRDGSSVFLSNVRYGYFPAVSLAWRISQESFLKNVTFINDLKLRYSWAELGSNNNVNGTNPFNLYGSSAGRSFYSIDGNNTVPTSGFFRSNIGNPGTSWEGDIISNVGMDATILNNKVEFTIDYYKKKISGLLFTASGAQYDVVFVGDAALPRVNIGDMQNTGIDFTATYHGAVSKDFKFDITGILTSYNNKIVKIPGVGYFDGPTIRNDVPTRNQVGHAEGAFYGYKVIGLFQDAADVAKSPTQTDAAPGLFKYQDNNGVDAQGNLTGKPDGKITAEDRTFIGDPNPKFTYGFNIGFSFKNFDFSSFFFGSYGNDIFNQTKYFTDFPDFFKGAIRTEVATNAWTPANTNTSIPKLRTTGGFSSDQVANSYFISKGSYLRSKQMQLGFTLPASVVSRFGIERLRIYIQAANLFTVTKYKGTDPELQSSDINNTVGFGIDQGNYPHTASYLVGVNLTF